MPIKLSGSTSGSVTVQAPAVAGTNTLTLPAATGNLLSDQSIVPGSSSVPTNGMYLPAANALGFATNSTNAMYIDASQNVGIGTTSPSQKLEVVGQQTILRQTSTTSYTSLRLYNDQNSAVRSLEIDYSGSAYSGSLISGGPTGESAGITTTGAYPLVLGTSNTARMTIDSSGNLLVGTTNASFTNTSGIAVLGPSSGTTISVGHSAGTANGSSYYYMLYNGTAIGTISQNGTTAVAYNTTSDYRLKENVTPMTVGLATISALKPVTYDWVGTNENGEGFIAHELQEVIPHAVTGVKDAIDEDGKPIYQGVDYSKIVVHLVAAIQELSAEVEALKAKVGA